MTLIRAALSALFATLLLATCFGQPAPMLAWQRTLSGVSHDAANSVDGDGLGHIYTAGHTDGGLAAPNLGPHEAFFAKYDAAGSLLWTRQIATPLDDHAHAISADALGSVFIAGGTNGSLDGMNLGGSDAFVAKYDGAGNHVWTRQFGTNRPDAAFGVTADGLGNVYVAGSTNQNPLFPYPRDAFLRKYDAGGVLQWSRTIDGAGDFYTAFNVTADGVGNAYIVGDTTGDVQGTNAGSYDAFVIKFDPAGNELWRRQHGTTSTDFIRDAAADSVGNVFLAGFTSGDLGGPNAGIYDAFVIKYDPAGNLLWTRQLGTTAYDEIWGAATDSLGNVYISGDTEGALAGMNAGRSDAFVTKYDAAGNPLWTRQLGSAEIDSAGGVWADGLGGVYVSGVIDAIGRGNNGGDAFLTKFAEVPEPSAAFLFTMWATAVGGGRLSRRERRVSV